MGILEKVVRVLSKSVEGWKTRMEVTDCGKVAMSRWIIIASGFLQGDSYPAVGFCLTEVPIAMLLEETDVYSMGLPVDRKPKRTQFFIDDLKVCQECHEKLESN